MIGNEIHSVSWYLARFAKETPDRPAIYYRDRVISYRELDYVVRLAAMRLETVSRDPRERIGVLFPREPGLITAYLALARIGRCAVPLNPNLDADELHCQARQFGFRLVVTDETSMGKAVGALPDNHREGIISLDDLVWSDISIPDNPPEHQFVEPDVNDVAYFNFTSGSAGDPKVCPATHANIWWNTKSSVEAFEIGPQDRHLCLFAPFAHPHEIYARAIMTGGSIALTDNRPKTVGDAVIRYGVTCLMGIVPVYRQILKIAASRPEWAREIGRTLRIPESGGMFTPDELIESFEALFGVSIYPVWGSTETIGIAAAMPLGEKRRGSFGKTCPHYNVSIVDEDGLPASAGQIGRMVVSGPGVCNGYRLPDEKSLSSGVFRSEDLVSMDDEGYFTFHGRMDGMIKVAARRVYPAEIERTALRMPGIADAVVLPKPNKLRGEIPVLHVELEPDAKLTESEIKRFCIRRLDYHAVPRSVWIWEEFPKTPAGKIDRKVLSLDL